MEKLIAILENPEVIKTLGFIVTVLFIIWWAISWIFGLDNVSIWDIIFSPAIVYIVIIIGGIIGGIVCLFDKA